MAGTQFSPVTAMGRSLSLYTWFSNVFICISLALTVGSNNISYKRDETFLNKGHSKYKNDYHMKEKLGTLFTGNGIFVQAAEFITSHGKQDIIKVSELSVSGSCLNDSLLILDGVKKEKEWALRMIDAMGKIPSGLLYGETNWYGDFDECVRITKEPSAYMDVKAPYNTKYCLANIPIPGPIRFEFRSILPPGINTAVCVPGTCSETEIKQMMNFFIEQRTGNEDISHNITFEVDDVLCKTPNLPIDKLAISAIVFCSLYGSLLVLATVYDIVKSVRNSPKIDLYHPDGANETEGGDMLEKRSLIGDRKADEYSKPFELLAEKILYFSLYNNMKKILDLSNSAKSAFISFHGARFLSMAWVVLGHTYQFGTVVFANGFTFLPELLDKLASQVIYNSSFSVDTFFLMSAALVATAVIKEWKRKNGKINWFHFCAHRFLRLSPTYFVLLFLMLGLSKYFYNGPLWPAHGMEYDSCHKTWWYNLLYINNFAPSSDEMCMDWTWYLADDMQFYLVAPFFIVPLMYSERLGVAVITIATAGSAVIGGVLSYIYELQPHTTATNDNTPTMIMVYYVKPYCRIGPYLLGILLAYYVQKMDGRVKINKVLNIFIWVIATTAACCVLYGLYEKSRVFEPLPVVQAAFYMGSSRIIWSLSICWVFFACATGNAEFVNKILSWKPFIFLGRLTFCVYLTHPIVLSLYFLSFRKSLYYTDLVGAFVYLGTLTATHMVGFLVSISLEIPMMNIEKLLFSRK